jgi:hypothetical protein
VSKRKQTAIAKERAKVKRMVEQLKELEAREARVRGHLTELRSALKLVGEVMFGDLASAIADEVSR